MSSIGGSLEYQVDGEAPATVNAGEVFFVPAEANSSELATYFVEKGKPLVVHGAFADG